MFLAKSELDWYEKTPNIKKMKLQGKILGDQELKNCKWRELKQFIHL